MKLKLCALTALLFSFAFVEQTLAQDGPPLCSKERPCPPGMRCHWVEHDAGYCITSSSSSVPSEPSPPSSSE